MVDAPQTTTTRVILASSLAFSSVHDKEEEEEDLRTHSSTSSTWDELGVCVELLDLGIQLPDAPELGQGTKGEFVTKDNSPSRLDAPGLTVVEDNHSV